MNFFSRVHHEKCWSCEIPSALDTKIIVGYQEDEKKRTFVSMTMELLKKKRQEKSQQK